MSERGTVLSVNVGKPKDLQVGSRMRTTGIFKEPQEGRVPIQGVTVGDDVQMDKRYHGGPFQAVYAYASEDYEWWSKQLARELSPGIFGENITTRDIDITNALLGERWRVGTALLEITDPRIPCSTLRSRMGIRGFVKTFAEARRFGAYFSIVEEGDVAAGDEISIVERPDHEVTIARMGAVMFDKNLDRAEKIVEALGADPRRVAWLEKLRRKATS